MGRVRWSKLYSFACFRPGVLESELPHILSGPGFSRVVMCNQPAFHKRKPLRYPNNQISTTKYNIITFLPKALFEQFRRIANLFFLLTALLSITSLSPTSPLSVIMPLVIVVGLSMAKEALEDWKRFFQDRNVNLRKVKVHSGDGTFGYKPWQSIGVGDIVKIEKDQFFPADLLLLSSSFEDGICYVETMNLDGETNLKVKRSLECTLLLDEDMEFKDFKGVIRCEDPNPNLYSFVGNFEFEQQTFAVSPEQVLLRDSKLRNTQYVYGVVIFTGHDSKVMQNRMESPSKRSTIEKRMDKIIYFMFAVLVLVSLVSSMGFGIMTKVYMPDWWYMKPNEDNEYYNPNNPGAAVVYHLVTAIMLYSYLIPISLYVSIELVKVLQAGFINQDLRMYDPESGTPAQARTSNLNEELGQVDTILSDKTGTLTCNQMDFIKCSIAGTSYGVAASEVEIAAAKRLAHDLDSNTLQDLGISKSDLRAGSMTPTKGSYEITTEEMANAPDGTEMIQGTHIKGFNFKDDRLMHGNWLNEPHADVILSFFRILAVCHTAIPDQQEETGAVTYEAESPDEAAFVIAAKEFGFEFFKRTQTSVVVKELDPHSGHQIEREYRLLNLLEFNSTRKRMSVVIRDEDGQIFLFCKGADSVIFERLGKNGKEYEEATRGHLANFGDGGLRTLAIAYKPISETEYSEWNSVFMKAKTTIGTDRETLLEAASDMIEKDLLLVGATAIEDKLQKGVPECIDKLAQAGLKIWVLTGDKMETAINIGFACSLLRQGMKQICLAVSGVEDFSNQVPSKAAARDSIMLQITNAYQTVSLETNPDAAFALIVDGKALAYCLEDDVKSEFLKLAVECASVICCRVSPKQKALVTRLVKEGTGKTTLGIGDGANDVGMIQEADIGVGISGVEGMQAVMASDFAIAQFRFLERLLVVHGHWCYKRIAVMVCYFFFKNIAFGLSMFYYEAYASFSGQSLYDSWYMVMFNVILTSFPVIALGVFEQDVDPDVCLEFPALYQQGAKNVFFNSTRVFGWMANGVYVSIVTMFFNVGILHKQAFRRDGQTSDMAIMGTTMFTCLIWTLNCQVALIISHFTWIQHIVIWGSIGIWYVIMFVYGLLSPTISMEQYEILQEKLGSAPIFWIALPFIVLTSLLPYFIHAAMQRTLNPMDHHIIQEIKYLKQDVKDRHMWSQERAKAKHRTKIGFSARVDAKMRHLKEKLHRKRSSTSTAVGT